MKRATALVVVSLISVLAGCGGGSGSSGTTSYVVQPTSYTVQLLPSVSGKESRAEYVTSDGRVFGQVRLRSLSAPEQSTRLIWQADGRLTVVEDGPVTREEVVNEQGVVASSGPGVPFVYDPIGNNTVYLRCLHGSWVPGGDDYASPQGINSAGVVVGESGMRPVMWDNLGNVATLEGLSDHTTGSAMDINSHGQIAGCLGRHPIVWNPNGTIETQYPDVEGFWCSQALLINDAGCVVIGAHDGDLVGGPGWCEWAFKHIVVRTPAGGRVSLRNLGYAYLSVYDMNSWGQIVGAVSSDRFSLQAAVWNPDGTGLLLPVPAGKTFSCARGINDSCAIVGWTADPSLILCAAIWKPQ